MEDLIFAGSPIYLYYRCSKMQHNAASILCITVFLWLVLSPIPGLAQGSFLITYPNLGSVRWYFNYPSEVDAGAVFVVIATGEHVPGSPGNTPALRVNSEPTPLVVPMSTAADCDPNSCWFGWMVDNNQRSMRMQFSVSANAPPGQILVLKVDTADMGGPRPGIWQNVVDIQVKVKTLPPPPPPPPPPPVKCDAPCTHFDPNTNSCVSTCTPGQQCENNQCLTPCPAGMQRDPQTNSCVCPAGLQWNPDTKSCERPFPTEWIILGVVVALVAIGIVAVFMLTRRKPPPAAAYKPYPAAPQPLTLKPGAPQAVKPVAHVPRVVARREEEKK
jgi:hypothetical protein